MKPINRTIVVKSLMVLIAFTSIVYTQGYPDLFTKIPNLTYREMDTTDISKLIELSDFVNYSLHPEICFFLVEKGVPDIAPKIKWGISKAFNNHKYSCDWYISGLYKLHDPELLQYTNLLLDSIVAQRQKGIYWDTDFITRLISVTCYYGDLSRYQLLIDILNSQTYKDSYELEQLEAYAGYPSMKAQVFEDLKKFASHENAEYREGAIAAMRSFKDYPGQKELLREVAMNDSSFTVRLESTYWLYYQYKDLFVIDAYKKIILEAAIETDTSHFRRALYRLADVASPYGLVALEELSQPLPAGFYQNEVNLSIKVYEPEDITDKISLTDAIDSLKSYTHQCNSLQFVGSANFAKELTNHLANAKKHLNKKDSLKCAQEVEKFQSKVDKEYKATNIPSSRGKGGRFVTIEGWKFLYYNAQYIIERLVKLPAKSQGTLLQQINELKAELTRQSNKKNIGGVLLVKSLNLLADQAKKQLQKSRPSTNDSATAALSIASFQLLVDETWELTQKLTGRSKKFTALYVYNEAYIQLHYRAKYIIESLPAPKTLLDLKSVQMEDEIRKEFDTMQKTSKEQ